MYGREFIVSKNKAKKPKLILKNGKHERLSGWFRCSNCQKQVVYVKRYPYSNRGEVDLCYTCDEPVRYRSYKRKNRSEDALDRAVHIGHFGARSVRKRW